MVARLVDSGTNLLPALVRMPVRAAGPDPGDLVTNRIVGCTGAKQRFQIESRLGEETSYQLAIGGEAYSRAARAERLRYRTDDADFPRAIQEFVIDSGRAAVRSAHFTDREAGMDCVQHFLLGDRLFKTPTAGIADIH